MKKWLKKITGLQKLEDDKKAAEEALAKAQKEAEEAKRQEELAKMTPKERATARGEPWVAVLDTKVNKDNIRNGFFELDWNDHFIVQLKKSGYGYDGDPDEEIVDRWFQTVCRNIALEVYEQQIADPEKRNNDDLRVIQQRDIGNGRTEIS